MRSVENCETDPRYDDGDDHGASHKTEKKLTHTQPVPSAVAEAGAGVAAAGAASSDTTTNTTYYRAATARRPQAYTPAAGNLRIRHGSLART